MNRRTLLGAMGSGLLTLGLTMLQSRMLRADEVLE
jgi:hypothetical protein